MLQDADQWGSNKKQSTGLRRVGDALLCVELNFNKIIKKKLGSYKFPMTNIENLFGSALGYLVKISN